MLQKMGQGRWGWNQEPLNSPWLFCQNEGKLKFNELPDQLEIKSQSWRSSKLVWSFVWAPCAIPIKHYRHHGHHLHHHHHRHHDHGLQECCAERLCNNELYARNWGCQNQGDDDLDYYDNDNDDDDGADDDDDDDYDHDHDCVWCHCEN